jgi:tRNA threonylcarbamoyladenosine biosynthesis protein TsaE
VREVTFLSIGPEETFALGAALGKLVGPGDFIALDGELGAGKTQFVRGLAAGADISPEETVSSPSFTLVNEYRCRIPLHHLDLYRLTSPRDVVELGFDELLGSQGATIVEWPDRLEAELPSELMLIRFEILDGDERKLVISGWGERYALLAGQIADRIDKKML